MTLLTTLWQVFTRASVPARVRASARELTNVTATVARRVRATSSARSRTHVVVAARRVVSTKASGRVLITATGTASAPS